MEQYLINDLERLSGIKAHTIRIWEKRFALIKPSRTATNRRYYSGDQLKKLMNISTLLSQGHKISALAALTDKEIGHAIERMHTADDADVVIDAYIHDLTMAMLTFDEAGFERTFTEVVTRFGFYDCMLMVLNPFLKKIGLLWIVDKTMPVQEHFASAIIKRKIMAATDALKPPVKADKRFALFLPPGEWHEIGLLFANYIIRAKGIDTLFLGQNVPFADIKKITELTKPKFLLTFYISVKPKEEVQQEIELMAKENAGATVLVTGGEYLLGDLKFKGKNITYLRNPDALLTIL